MVSEESLQAAEKLIEDTFGPSGMLAPQELPSKLEQAMALGRNSWPLSAIRRLADKFLEHAEGRKKGSAWEARWLNLAGFCLRPGFGFPGDDLRIEQARRIYAGGITFANQVQSEIDWWIFWGRVAGGLNRNQQVDVYQRLAQFLLPRGQKKPPRINTSLLREMWRTAASMELLPMHTKTELGEAIAKRIRAGDYSPSDLWCLSRIGARRLFHGPINQVIPAATASRWLETLANKAKNAEEAIASIGARTGDASRDLPETTLATARRALAGNAAALGVLEGDSERDAASIFGEELPSGLVVAGE
jgi:hypothetical protein